VTDDGSKTSIRVTVIDIVWQEQREAVNEAMKEILDVTDLDTASPEYFQQRTAAAKLALERMTERDRAQMYALVEKRKNEGNTPAVQRQYVTCVC
jgi:hypothetical protein